MSSIRVSWQGINTSIDGYASQRQELSTSIASLRSVKSYRCLSGQGFSSIYKTLDKVIQSLDGTINSMRNLESGLSSVLKAYTDCENSVFEHIKATSTEEKTAPDNPFSWGWNKIWDMISNGGIIGDGISAISGLISGDWSADNIISSIEDILSVIGGISSTISKGSDANWKEVLFGLSKELSELDTSSWDRTFLSSLKKQFGDDLFWTGATSVGDKVKIVTTWGGHVLSLVSSFLDNKAEFEGQEGSTGRMLAETGIETVVDIGIGAVSTAAVSAVAAAMGFVGAPAIVIGAAAIGVAWAANGVCKWVTGGKDIGEVYADAVCDTVEKVKEGWNSFTKWGQSLFAFG